MAKSVDNYIAEKVQVDLLTVFDRLRAILREEVPELKETIKWGAPCYVGRSNVVGLVALKNYVSLWFYQGALLEDPEERLIQASEKTTALRQLRFAEVGDIDRPYLKQLLQEAVENDQRGKKVKKEKSRRPTKMPIELQQILDSDPGIKKSYESLSPSQKREYVEHVGEAKRGSTRERRAKKAKALLAEGKGLNDQYRK